MPAVEMLRHKRKFISKGSGCHLTSVKAVEGGRPGNLYTESQVRLDRVGSTPTLWRSILQRELTRIQQ